VDSDVTGQAYSTGDDISPYRGVLAVDAEKFSANADSWLPNFGIEVEDLLAEAMSGSGLHQAWESRLFADSAGEGYFFGFSPVDLARIITPFVPNLQKVLHRRNANSNRYSPLMRARVAIHVGPIYDKDDPRRDGTGSRGTSRTGATGEGRP